MWTAIGDALPFAIGLALSPFAIVTGIVLLLGNRGIAKTALFGVGWFAALAVIATVALLVVEAAADESVDYTETGVDVLQLIFAALFFALAVVAWIKRPSADGAAGGDSKESKLLARLDDLTLLSALGIGALQGFVVIKNIPLALSAGAVFGEADLRGVSAVVAVVVFALVASLGVLVPLGVAMVGGARVTDSLARSRTWIEANMSPITLTVLVILGAVFLGRGLGVFS